MNYRLRSNPKELLFTDNLQQVLNCFELGFKGGNKNEAFLQLPNKQKGYVECIYIENTPENRKHWFPLHKDFNNVLFVRTNKQCETSYSYSAMSLEETQGPYNKDVWFAIDCSKHKDYLSMLADRQAKQKQQAIIQAIATEKLHNDTLAQIEQLKTIAKAQGLMLALDYITSPDDEDNY